VHATPFDNLVADIDMISPGTVRYASPPCTCSPTRSTSTKFTSQEGFGFTLTSSLTGDCTAPITSFSLTAATQSLTQAMFYVKYDGQCPLTQDCSQVRCEAKSAGQATLSCSFEKPDGYTSQMHVYILWQTTSALGNRQYPLPHPAFIPLNFDCAASSYTSTCNNGVCGCGAGESASSCPTDAPSSVPSAPVPITATRPPVPVVNNPGPVVNTPSPTSPPTTKPTGPRLIFNDDFNRLDYSVWEHELTLAGDGNWCFQQYTNNRTNTFVRDGKLYIKPTLTSEMIGDAGVRGVPSYTMDLGSLEPAMQCTGSSFYGCARTSTNDNYLNPTQSAAIRTAHSFSFKYGRVEIRAKLPRGDWLWPAIWLLPRWSEYGQWPMSGEIDIMESRGNAPGYRAGGNDEMASTLHWGPYFPADVYEKTHESYRLPAGQSFADDFHTFGLYWDSTGIYTYVDHDSNRVLNVNWTKTSFYDLGEFSKVKAANPWATGGVGAPFDQEFYLILDVAVGGAAPGFRGDPQASYFPDFPERPWRNDEFAMKSFWDNRAQWLPSWKGDDVALQVDWVKVWQQ